MLQKLKSLPLSVFLVLIVASAVLPVLFFAATMVDHFVKSKREAIEQSLVQAAADLSTAFDQETIATIRALEAIAKSEALRNKDLRGFREELVRIVDTQPSWSSILLHDADLKWVLSTRVSYNVKLPAPPEPESIRQVLRTGQPIVGKIIKVVKTPAEVTVPTPHGFAIRAPVKDDRGQVKYVLSAIVSTDSIQSLINRFSQAPDEWVRALSDHHGMIAGRSRSPEKYIGGPLSDSLLEAIERRPAGGFVITKTLDGVTAYTAFRPSPFSGWYTAVAVPQKIIVAEAWRRGQNLLWVGLAALAFSALLAIVFSRWLSRSIRAGTEGAAILAKGETPKMPESRIREVEDLRNSLLLTSQLLKTREKAKSDFLAKMSHELRTPLGLVLGMTDSISNNLIPPEDREKSWEIVKRNGQQLLRLIDDILDLSKLEGNHLNIENVELSLPDLISSIVEDFSPRAEQKGVALKFVLEENAPRKISSDPVRIRQIISNLIGNAVKFTSKGTIEIRLYPAEGQRVRLDITDTGIGLNEEQQSALFLDFSQGDVAHARQYGGTGLGLSLSRKLARLLGGDVRLVKSQPGAGSVFEVTFQSNPLSRQPDKVNQTDESERQLKPSLKILLVEDTPDNVILVRTYLKNTGAEITVANDGVEALRFVGEQEFDIILMDLQMPNMDGYEATRLIRDRGCKVPIVALTAHALGEHRTRALQVGFTHFLGKPFRRTILVETIEEAVRNP